MILENSVTCEFLERAIDSMPYGIVISNSKGQFILHNKMAVEYFSTELEEGTATSAKRWEEELGIYTLDKTYKYPIEASPIQQALNGGITSNEKYFMISKTMPDGFYIKVSGFPVYDETEQIEAAMVVFEDITKEQIVYEDIFKKITELEKWLIESRT